MAGIHRNRLPADVDGNRRAGDRQINSARYSEGCTCENNFQAGAVWGVTDQPVTPAQCEVIYRASLGDAAGEHA